MALNTITNMDLAAALSKLSPEDRAYVDRVATDMRPTRRRRRRRNAVAETAAPAPKAAKKTARKKAAKKTAPNRLIQSKRERAAELAE